MLLTEAVHGRIAIREEMLPKVKEAWKGVLQSIAQEKGADFLSKALPLRFVLFSAALKEWEQ